MLLEREQVATLDALERLVGLQAQDLVPPYCGLWARIEGFNPEELGAHIAEGRAVRVALMRSTIHLVSRADVFRLRPVVQSVVERSMRGAYGKALRGVEREELVSRGKARFREGPALLSDVAKALKEDRWPEVSPQALAYGVRTWIPVLQVPPRGVWGQSGRPIHAPIEDWLGQALGDDDTPDEMLLRYLRAFGPASVMDAQQWSGLTKLARVFEELRPRLRSFCDEDGRELFDVEDGHLPDPDTPAPVRLVAPFDNLVLSHADRRRIVPEEYRDHLSTLNGMVPGTVLLDGFVAGMWTTRKARGSTSLAVTPFRRWSRPERDGVDEEATILLSFLNGDDSGDLEYLPIP